MIAFASEFSEIYETSSAAPLSRQELRALLLWVSRQLLAGAEGRQSGPITVMVKNAEGSRYVAMHAGPDDAPPAVLASPTTDTDTETLLRSFLSEEEREIVDVLGDRAMKGSAIGNRLRLSKGSKARILFSNLRDRGVLFIGPDGYEVPPSMRRLLALVPRPQPSVPRPAYMLPTARPELVEAGLG
jgi:hypothetical protein